MEFENYPKPPIQEAILDIFTVLPSSSTLGGLAEYGKLVEEDYPEKKPRFQFSSKIKFNAEDASKASADGTSTQTGWIFRSPMKDKAAQARLDGFTFNRMPTYEGWAKFSAEAKTLWERYEKVAQPQMISSISLRYINRVQLPFPLRDFREYCVLFPTFPKGLPTALSEFLLRFAGPATNAPGATATIAVTFQPPEIKKGVLPLIVDVHVAQIFNVPAASDSKRIWDTFELLRTEKNVLFESSITESARNLFR